MTLANYERRASFGATILSLVSCLIGTAAILTLLQYMQPVVFLHEDHVIAFDGEWLWQKLALADAGAALTYRGEDWLTQGFCFAIAVCKLCQALWVTGALVQAAPHIGFSALAGLTALVTTYVLALADAPIIDMRDHLDGPQLIRDSAGKSALKRMMNGEADGASMGFELAPDCPLSKQRELRGVLICGATGSGKTRIFLFLLDRILVHIKAWPQRKIRLLIHDTTGEILEGLPLSDKKFAALHGHRPGGWSWAMGRDILTKSDAEATAGALAPQTNDGIWGDGAATFMAAALIMCQNDFGLAWGIPEFYDALLEDPVDPKPIYRDLYPPAALLIEIDPSTGGLSKTTISFLLTFRAAVLRYLRPLAETWRAVPRSNGFSIVEWLHDSNRRQPRVVLLQRSARHSEMSRAWIGAMTDLAAAHATDEGFPNSQKRRVYLALEELPSLGVLRALPSLLDTGRNKGIGIIASVQEPEQLTALYGDLPAKSLIKRFRTRIVCQQIYDRSTEDLSADMLGTRSVMVEQETTTSGKSQTRSRSVARVEKEVPVVSSRHLAFKIGVLGNRVRAIVAGFEDPVEIDWPLTIWRKRRSHDKID